MPTQDDCDRIWWSSAARPRGDLLSMTARAGRGYLCVQEAASGQEALGRYQANTRQFDLVISRLDDARNVTALAFGGGHLRDIPAPG